MVKVYAVLVLYKGINSANILKSAYDLRSFSYFQRSSVQEFMTFVSKTMVERTQQSARQSVKEGEYMLQVYVRGDNLSGVLITDHEYPNRVAHTLITKTLDEFSSSVPASAWPAGNETTIDFPVLSHHLDKYQDPKEADALTKIQNDLDETKIILHDTIKAVLERGEKLDDLVAKSDSLSMHSKAFYKTARKTNSCCNF